MKTTLAVVGAALVLAACNSSVPPEPAATPSLSSSASEASGSPGPVEVTGCPNAAGVIAEPSAAVEGKIQADIDGDGEPDEARLYVDDAGDPPCGAFLVVDLASGPTATAIWEQGSDGGLAAPRMMGPAEINGVLGAEIVVREGGGASTEFFGAYTMASGVLERIRLVGDDGDQTFLGLFAHSGSVGHLAAVDCLTGDRFVVSTARPAPARRPAAQTYVFVRSFYRPNGAEFEFDGRQTRRRAIGPNTFPEFEGGPFAHC